MFCQFLRVLAELYYLFDLVRENARCRIVGSLCFLAVISAAIFVYRNTESVLAAILYPSVTVIALLFLVILCGYAWRRLGPFIYRKSEECER